MHSFIPSLDFHSRPAHRLSPKRSGRILLGLSAVILSLLLPAAVLGQAVNSGSSAEDATAIFADLAAGWRQERDALVVDLTQAWLAARPATELRRELLQLAALETRLANEPRVPLYTAGLVAAREPQDVLAHVARAYLRERGAVHEPGQLLRRRPFEGVRLHGDSASVLAQ